MIDKIKKGDLVEVEGHLGALAEVERVVMFNNGEAFYWFDVRFRTGPSKGVSTRIIDKQIVRRADLIDALALLIKKENP